jgi:hypothetical protein
MKIIKEQKVTRELLDEMLSRLVKDNQDAWAEHHTNGMNKLYDELAEVRRKTNLGNKALIIALITTNIAWGLVYYLF